MTSQFSSHMRSQDIQIRKPVEATVHLQSTASVKTSTLRAIESQM